MSIRSGPFYVAFATFLFSFPGTALSQPVWLNQDHNNAVAIEFLKPNFAGDVGTTFPTMAVFMTFRQEIGEKVSFVAELPLAHYGPGGSLQRISGSETTLGNIYVGLEGRRAGAFGEAGVRLPTSDEHRGDALIVGIFSDLGRWEAFLPNAFVFSAWSNYRSPQETGLGGRIRVGSSIWVPTEGEDVDVLLHYTGQLFFRDPVGELSAGFTGRLVVTEAGDLGKRTLHELGFSGSLTRGNVKPALHFKVPLDDDLSSVLDFVMGLSLAVLID